jgi:HSP20 family protein
MPTIPEDRPMPEFPSFKPLRLALDLERRIEEAFSKLIHEPWGKALASRLWQPAIDVYETDDAYFIEADLPGVAPNSVEIRLEGDRLSICGRRQSMAWAQSGRMLRLERASGEFCRVLELEHPVDCDRIEKQYEQGIFRARLPKRHQPPAPSASST